MSKKYAMVIDLQKCVGCSACSIACKNENNTDIKKNWSSCIQRTTGTFPNVRYEYIPTLCNHCENAACVKACPTQAMHKDANGLTLHNADKCIGCKTCMLACPYDVIHFNKKNPHEFWSNEEAAIEGGTPYPREVIEKTGTPIPYYNADREKTYEGVRYKGIVEKCTLCDHRLADGEEPYCVVACPAKCRHIGDLNDPSDEINMLLGKYPARQLQPDKGTKPKVYYIRSF
jgi:molybdopterin-containing oxidoreductase family iron-sulfur binding subunit